MVVAIAGARYALPLENVQEVIAPRPLARVFHAVPLMAGVINLRGEVLPVLEPALLLGGSPVPDLDGRVVVVRERGSGGRRAGLRVSELVGLRELGEQGFSPVPATLPPAVAALLLGVLSEPPACAVLDVGALLDVPELAALAGRAAAG
ncbi:MAG TPA: chemotaxis protein CheW [Polyangiaceae bacterium]|nr:chemotaxis protein CheW [Polyangiaceae bacterium]